METKKLIGGLLAGAAIGIAVGILLAPGSGEQTKNRLVKGSKRLGRDLRNSVDDSLDSLKDQFNRGVDETAKRGKDAIAHASERLKV